MSARDSLPNEGQHVPWLRVSSVAARVNDRRSRTRRGAGPDERVSGQPAPRRWSQGLDRPLA